MTIGEISRISGVPASTIRYYEASGLLPRAARRGGQRIFDDTVLTHLTVIGVAQRAGFTIREISALIKGFARDRWKAIGVRKLEQLEERARQLEASRLLLRKVIECGCLDLEECGAMLADDNRREPRIRPVATKTGRRSRGTGIRS